MSLESINLLTGPVTISQSVYERFLDLCSTMNLSSAINNLTLCLPHSLSSVEVGDALLEMNCEIGYKSAYLIEKKYHSNAFN